MQHGLCKHIGLPQESSFIILDNAQASGQRYFKTVDTAALVLGEMFIPGMIRNLKTETGKW